LPGTNIPYSVIGEAMKVDEEFTSEEEDFMVED
jgi:hypothetical protein